MATEYTPNYNLDLYAGTDKPNLRDQYNAAMGKIDTQLKTGSDNLVAANNNISTLQTQMGTANDDISTLQTQMGTANKGISKNAADIAAVRTTAESALSLAQTNEGDIAAAETDVTNLTKRVTAVEGKASANETDIAELQSTVSQQTTDISGKAPIEHSSATTEYGIGSATEYGHVKLVDEPGTSTVEDGVAATPKLVETAIDNVESMQLLHTETLQCTGSTITQATAKVNVFLNSRANQIVISYSFKSDQGGLGIISSGAGRSTTDINYTVPEQYRPSRELHLPSSIYLAEDYTALIVVNTFVRADGVISIDLSCNAKITIYEGAASNASYTFANND